MSKRYRLTPQAEQDVSEIVNYIADRSPQNALRVFDALHAAMRMLAEAPGLGHRREDLTDEPVRFWPVYSFLVVYLPDTKPIEIVHVVHGARDLKALLDLD